MADTDTQDTGKPDFFCVTVDAPSPSFRMTEMIKQKEGRAMRITVKNPGQHSIQFEAP